MQNLHGQKWYSQLLCIIQIKLIFVKKKFSKAMYNDKLLTYAFLKSLPYVPLGSSDVGTLYFFIYIRMLQSCKLLISLVNQLIPKLYE